MTADFEGSTVFVLDTFLRRNVLHGDVAAVRQSGAGGFTLGTLSTVKAEALTNLRVELYVTQVHGKHVKLQRVQDGGSGVQNLDILTLPLPSTQARTLRKVSFEQDVVIEPQAAKQHTQEFGTAAIPHRTAQRSGYMWSGWVLDIPESVRFFAIPHRCLSCKGSCGSKVEEQTGFPVTEEDIRRAFPNVIVIRTPKEKRHFMTRRYLLEILMQFYSSLNCRAVRRSLLDLCTARALDAELLWLAHATPKAQVLRWTVLQAFGKTLGNMVETLQAKLIVYNAQGLRHDGNMGLAKRVVMPGAREHMRVSLKKRILGRRKRCGCVVLAFTGALLLSALLFVVIVWI